MNILRTASILALAAAALAANAQNLVQDPGFESSVTGTTTYTNYNPGMSPDGFWQVSNPSSLANNNFFILQKSSDVAAGTKSAYLSRCSVSQSLVTVPGQAYTLSFLACATNSSISLKVDFGDASQTMSLPYSTAATTSTLSFAATGPTTTLRFSPDYYMVLDNVSVTAAPVPEPSALAALGLGALGLLKRRKRA